MSRHVIFSTACFRVGHTLLSPTLLRLGEAGTIPEGNIPLAAAFFAPEAIILDGGIDPILRGLAAQPAQEIDPQVIGAVRNFLFGPPGAGGLDLASLNIQRGRDHGLRRAVRVVKKSGRASRPAPEHSRRHGVAYPSSFTLNSASITSS